MPEPRLVVDTNIMVPALVGLHRAPGGPKTAAAALLVAWRLGFCEILASDDMLAEYERILSGTSFGITPAYARRWCASIRRLAAQVRVSRIRPLLTIDPEDDVVLKTAIEGKADLLVTHNLRHFREVASLTVGTPDLRYRGLRIVGLSKCWDEIKARHPGVEDRVRRSARKL
jgi:predicted nucleic acid-binding protein